MKYLKIASILTLISVICAAIIASFSMITAQTIKDNKEQTELETYKLIYEDYASNKDITESLDDTTADYSCIQKAVICYDASSNELGYIYSVSGKNAYGTISLMVAIQDSKVIQVEFVENTESFGSIVNSHVKANYPSSKSDIIYIGINEAVDSNVSALSYDDVKNIETAKSGATYGANLVKKLVLAALNARVKEA